jgi:RNA-binding protein required for 60S ribosomal subunit biogenesis
MAAVYKTIAKVTGSKEDKDKEDRSNIIAERKNKQRVLVLSSRGVTYRYGTSNSSTVDMGAQD